MIPEVRGGGTRPWEPPRKRVPKCLKGPKTTYTTIEIAENQSKISKKGPFSLYIGPPGPTQEMELMGPGGEGPSRSPPPRFLQPCLYTMIFSGPATFGRFPTLMNRFAIKSILFFKRN